MSLWEKAESLAKSLTKALPPGFEVTAGAGRLWLACPRTGVVLDLVPQLTEVEVEVELFVVLFATDLDRAADRQALEYECGEIVRQLFERGWRSEGYTLDPAAAWNPASSTEEGPPDLRCFTQKARITVHRVQDLVRLAEHANEAQQFSRSPGRPVTPTTRDSSCEKRSLV